MALQFLEGIKVVSLKIAMSTNVPNFGARAFEYMGQTTEDLSISIRRHPLLASLGTKIKTMVKGVTMIHAVLF